MSARRFPRCVAALVAGAVVAAPAGAAPPAAATAAAAGAAERPAFRSSSSPVTGAVRERVVGSSWRRGCPVPLGRLRYVRVRFHGFDGEPHMGELVVHRDAATRIRRAFRRLYAARFAIRRMRLVDDYGASDFRSIEADNTSAFNCRTVAGTSRWSEHAYGRAIDVNPIENPYVRRDGTTAHRRSRPYLDRSRRRRGMAVRGGALVRAFDAIGWEWGGRWSGPRDFQHFSATGR